jgi:hypothetical protein
VDPEDDRDERQSHEQGRQPDPRRLEQCEPQHHVHRRRLACGEPRDRDRGRELADDGPGDSRQQPLADHEQQPRAARRACRPKAPILEGDIGALDGGGERREREQHADDERADEHQPPDRDAGPRMDGRDRRLGRGEQERVPGRREDPLHLVHPRLEVGERPAVHFRRVDRCEPEVRPRHGEQLRGLANGGATLDEQREPVRLDHGQRQVG